MAALCRIQYESSPGYWRYVRGHGIQSEYHDPSDAADAAKEMIRSDMAFNKRRVRVVNAAGVSVWLSQHHKTSEKEGGDAMGLWVQVYFAVDGWYYTDESGHWTDPSGVGGRPDKTFAARKEGAIGCAIGYGKAFGRPTRVINKENGKIIWQSTDATGKDTTMDGTPDITEPIKLDRDKLIGRLNEIHDEEKKTREDAQAKETAARKDVETFLRDNLDRVAEFMKARLGGSWKDVLENLSEEEFRDDNYKPKDKEPTRRESDSEKFVRVLEMSNDDTVSLTPDQPLYELL